MSLSKLNCLFPKFWVRGNFVLTFLLSLCVIAGSFVGTHETKFFYFNFSTGTLIFHLIIIFFIAIYELLGEAQAIKIIFLTAFLDLLANLSNYYILDYPLPPYWMVIESPIGNSFQQLNVILLLVASYIGTGLGVVWFGVLLRYFFKKWLILRVSMLCLLALMLDLLLLLPPIIFISQDNYEIAWRMLSLASIKSISMLVMIPLTLKLIFKMQSYYEISKKQEGTQYI